jgi:hypothetical protein
VSIAGLLAGKSWDTNIGDAAVADAALDRVVHNVHRAS